MFIKEHITGQFTSRNEAWNVMADHFAYNSSIKIYGKDKYSAELREISKDEFSSLHFVDEASFLCTLGSKDPKYTDISVRKDEVEKAIEEIIALTERGYQT